MAKDVQYYKNVYYKGSMPDDTCEYLLQLSKTIEVVPSLVNCVRDLTKDTIKEVKAQAERYCKENGTYVGFRRNRSNDPIGTLRNEQTVGVAFLYSAISALLGDSVGLGKTVQVAALINLLEREYRKEGRTFRYCFLTKKTSVGQIRDKLIQFTGNFVELLDDGGSDSVSKWLERNKDERYPALAGTHSLLQNGDFIIEASKRPFDLVVIDESFAKKTTSDTYRNAKTLLKKHHRIVFLNATPFEINAREFYNQLALLDPTYMPNVGDFERLYQVKEHYTGFNRRRSIKYKDADKFREAVSLKYLARTRESLNAVYDDNHFKLYIVENSPQQKKLSKDSSLYYNIGDYPTGVDKSIPYSEDTTPKLAALNYILNNEIKPHENQCLIYCKLKDCQREMLEYVESWGYRVIIVNGETAQKKRTELIEGMNDGKYDVLITNVKESIDLTRCDNTVIYSIDPNPKALEQVEGRMTRDLNVIGKRLFMLVAAGKEKRYVDKHLKDRVVASDSFTTASKSMVANALKGDTNRVVFKSEKNVEDEDETYTITLDY